MAQTNFEDEFTEVVSDDPLLMGTDWSRIDQIIDPSTPEETEPADAADRFLQSNEPKAS